MSVGKKMSRRAFLARAAAVAAGVTLAGLGVQCGATPEPTATPTPKAAAPTKAPEATKAPEPTKAPAVAKKRKIVISNINGGSQEGSDKGWIWKPMREQFPELDIVNQWVSYATYKDKISLMIASGDIADLQFCHAFNDIPLMMGEGIIQETGPLLEKVGKNILAVHPPHIWLSTVYDGKQYSVIHNVYSLDIWNLAYRKDWLDKLGLDVPETLEEVKEAWTAFTKGDPDGNGNDDTYGRQFYNNVRFDDDVFHAFSVAIGHHYMGFWRKRASGQIELDWVQPEMKEALGWIRDCWAEGLIHPESLTVPLGMRNKNWDAGFTGQGYTSFKEMDGSLRSIKGVAPDAELIGAAPPKGPYGQGVSGEDNPWAYVISAKCKYPEDAVRIMDWMCSPEMAVKLMCGGVPGITRKDPTPEGWCVEYTAQEQLDMGKEWSDKLESVAGIGAPGVWGAISTVEPSIVATLSEDAQKHFDELLKGKYGPAAYEAIPLSQKYTVRSEKYVPVPADREYWPSFVTRFGELVPSVVAGTQDLDTGWKEWVDFFEKNGGPEMTEQVNAG